MSFADDMMKISSIYINQYKQDWTQALSMLVRLTVPIQILCMVYDHLVRSHELPSLEMLNLETKKEYWNMSMIICESDKDKAHQMCKALWFMNNILNIQHLPLKEILSRQPQSPDPF